MADILSFMVVMAAGLLFSRFLKPFHLPYVVVLILSGMLVGPHGFGLFVPDETMIFMGEIGLVFLMFMAGLETGFSTLPEGRKRVGMIAILNSSFPFLVGVGLAFYLGYGWISALLLGTIFVSSSIAIIIPSLEDAGLLKKPVGSAILGATIMEDVLSLVIFAFILQTVSPQTAVPLPIFYAMLFFLLIFLRVFIKELRRFYIEDKPKEDLFENELRFTFVILLGTVVIFEFLGLHPILAGFFAGFSLSGPQVREMLKRKLHVISYGLFIPIFFVLIGSETDLGVLWTESGIALVVASIVIASIGSKFVSGFIAGKLSGFSNSHSCIIGSATIPQLSTTLAVAFTGLELGILDSNIILAMTVLSMVTTFMGPFMVGIFASRR